MAVTTVRRTRTTLVSYWICTVLVTAELAVGGVWDVLLIPSVRETADHLRFPTYALVILGIWKLCAVPVLLSPRLPLIKEWAYAGIVFAGLTMITSHFWTGYQTAEVAVTAVLLILTAASWALRHPSRRLEGTYPALRRS